MPKKKSFHAFAILPPRTNTKGGSLTLPPPQVFNFEKDLQHDRHAEWKGGNTENHPDRQLVFSKDIAQQLRGSVSHLRQRPEVVFSCQIRRQLDNPGHLIERAQVLLSRSRVRSTPPSALLRVPVRRCTSAQPADELRLMPDNRENTAEIKQIARLDTFNIRRRTEWARASARCRAPQAGAPRLPVAGPLNSPFARVRTTVHVQHLPCHLTGFCEINHCVHNVLTSEMVPIGESDFKKSLGLFL